MTYQILSNHEIRLDFGDFYQTMTPDELAAYMRPFRDDDPDFYAELVHVYVLLTKPLPHPN